MPSTELANSVRIGWELNMRTALAALALLASFMLGSLVHAQIVSDTPSLLIAVRHADTLAEPGDRALSDAGTSRAKALVVAVRNAGVTAIITSQFRRSRDTAQPTASALGLTPEVIQISRAALDSHLMQLEAAVRKHKGGVVLVIGHEESVTQLYCSGCITDAMSRFDLGYVQDATDFSRRMNKAAGRSY